MSITIGEITALACSPGWVVGVAVFHVIVPAHHSLFSQQEKKGLVILDRQEQHPTIDDGANVCGCAECWGVISTCFGPSLGRSFVVALGVGSFVLLCWGMMGCWMVEIRELV
jgi:hypothetical protein